MAAGSRVFAATLQPILGVPPWCIFLAFIAALTLVNLRGIRECVWVNMVCTTIELGGLLFVIAVSLPYFGSVNYLNTAVRRRAHRSADHVRRRADILRVRRL